jgi:photosystem II stability/assembly factor-like uncharacterized protein
MRNRFFIIFTIGLLFLAGYSCILFDDSTLPIDTKLAEKHIPSDQFFLQRSFPDASIDLKAYKKALIQAKSSAIARNGFDNFDGEWRTEGPGNLGARVNTLAVHPANDQIIFAGFSGGGVFRTMDGGKHWTPVFDDQVFLAIGDIVFDPIDPNTIYVGTGDPNISGFPFLGDGLYKSEDLGETWKYIGLEEQRIISKILIHPQNNQIIYVAAMGLPFEPSSNKGLYKSTDGGKTWEQILFLREITGVIDVVFAADNPNVLFAAGWDRLRNNQVSITSGTGAKIYKSIDGGSSWNQLSGGLPLNKHSRIGLATSPDGIIAVYVNENHQFGGLYKTTDEGETWQAIPTDEDQNQFNPYLFGGFGWYFAKVRVHPNNPNDISVLGVVAYRTLDGGKNWEPIHLHGGIGVHSDVHDLVFTTSGKFILGTDGGLYRFDVDGQNGEDIENIPTTQIYRVAYNPHQPKRYFIGSQDSGTAGGNADGISSWTRFNWGGDGFQMAFHPDNPDVFYTESQRGGIAVTVDGGREFESATEGIDPQDRRNWDQPYFISSFDPNVLFTGTHRVYKSATGAFPTWEAISPDLTNGRTDFIEDGLSQTIATIDQSPLDEAVLYAGTTDGNVWHSLNGGADWTKLNGIPQRYITEIMASPTSVGTVYVSISGYKDNDNTAHVYKSIDFGANWEPIASNLPPLAINCLKIIPSPSDDIIFAGTDGGVYASLNGGSHWERLGTNMPIIAVYDLEWNPKENRLVAGTFARSALSYPLEGIIEVDNTLSSVNFKQEEELGLRLSPNPTQTDLTIEFSNKQTKDLVLLSIFDINGRLIKEVKRKADRNVRWKVNVQDFPNGLYLVRISGHYFNYSESFLKL